MARTPELDVDKVFNIVRASPKYRAIAQEFVQAITMREGPKEHSQAAAVKRVKRRLHQVVGAYVGRRPDYEGWLTQLREAAPGPELSAVVRGIMLNHVSTRERLRSCPDFYERIFEGISPPRIVADLGCGLGPLARGSMPIPADAMLACYDVVPEMLTFLVEALPIMGFPATGGVWDLLLGLPPIKADIVLLLKVLPCLSHADPDIGRRLLTALDAPVVIVSYPIASIGGRQRGMATFYDHQFKQLMRGLSYVFELLPLGGELVYRLSRNQR
jgi:16S rRNA (guanine(1405)-N(7))-methyltransferase